MDVEAREEGIEDVEEEIYNQKQSTSSEPLSKNQQKRLLRAQKNADLKVARRKWEREKKKANKQKRKLAGEIVGRGNRQAHSGPKVIHPARLVIDMSFDNLMTDREILSMVQQLSALYNSNKVSARPFSSIIFTGPSNQSLFETTIGTRMETKMQAHWRKWKWINLRKEGGVEGLTQEQGDQEAICKKEQLVYLTGDAETILECVHEDKVYIIGGLVDRNRHKRLCADRANQLGISTARLPIDAGRLNASTILTVNQVVEILLVFNETQDWQVTLDRCLPQRKVKKVQSEKQEEIQEEQRNVGETNIVQSNS